MFFPPIGSVELFNIGDYATSVSSIPLDEGIDRDLRIDEKTTVFGLRQHSAPSAYLREFHLWLAVPMKS
jgi:hypothetical protein